MLKFSFQNLTFDHRTLSLVLKRHPVCETHVPRASNMYIFRTKQPKQALLEKNLTISGFLTGQRAAEAQERRCLAGCRQLDAEKLQFPQSASARRMPAVMQFRRQRRGRKRKREFD